MLELEPSNAPYLPFFKVLHSVCHCEPDRRLSSDDLYLFLDMGVVTSHYLSHLTVDPFLPPMI